jgi:hypothetical protein
LFLTAVLNNDVGGVLVVVEVVPGDESMLVVVEIVPND